MSQFQLPRFTPWEAPARRGMSTPSDPSDVMLARVSTEAPRVPWDVFLRRHFRWEQGEHVAMIGPTGQGKTTLLTALLPLHPYVVVFATKPKDATMDALIEGGYTRVTKWESVPAERAPRRVLWPNAKTLDSSEKQREVFKDALNRIYREGGWTVAIDELWFVINELNLAHEVKVYLLQARSLGISLMVATQRPAWVPLEVYDQSTHLFFMRDNDETNLRRLSGISWRSADMIRYLIANLEQYQVLYVNTRTGAMCRTRAPAPMPAPTEKSKGGKRK